MRDREKWMWGKVGDWVRSKDSIKRLLSGDYLKGSVALKYNQFLHKKLFDFLTVTITNQWSTSKSKKIKFYS